MVGVADGAILGVAVVGMTVGENVGGSAITKLFAATTEVLTPVTATFIPDDCASFVSVDLKSLGENVCDVCTICTCIVATDTSW